MIVSRSTWPGLDLPGSEHDFCFAHGPELETTDPTTGKPVGTVRTATTDDVAEAVERAQTAFRKTGWRNHGATRARVLYRYAQSLRERIDPLAELLTREQGKTLGEARSEVLGSADMVEFYAGMARSLYGRSIALGDEVHGVVLREPVGVVGVITPWNWPLTLLVRALAPALAAGNACVVKPASLTPAITVGALAPLASDPDLPRGILACVVGSGGVVGDALVSNPSVQMVAFTGETGTGIGVMKRAADDLRKVSLELGGKSPNLVFNDAHLDKALDGAVNAAFTTTGQICTAGSRLLVQQDVADEFIGKLADRIKLMRLGDPLAGGTDIAPLVSTQQRDTVAEYAELGAKEGEVIAEAALPEDAALAGGSFGAPRLIGGLPYDSRVVREEIFGPVLTVHTFADEDEAVALANDTELGLAAGIWTGDLNRAWRVGRAVHAGTVWINTYHHFYGEAEVGGFGKSGLGRQQGVEGIHEFTETKHLNFDGTATLW